MDAYETSLVSIYIEPEVPSMLTIVLPSHRVSFLDLDSLLALTFEAQLVPLRDS